MVVSGLFHTIYWRLLIISYQCLPSDYFIQLYYCTYMAEYFTQNFSLLNMQHRPITKYKYYTQFIFSLYKSPQKNLTIILMRFRGFLSAYLKIKIKFFLEIDTPNFSIKKLCLYLFMLRHCSSNFIISYSISYSCAFV